MVVAACVLVCLLFAFVIVLLVTDALVICLCSVVMVALGALSC